MKCLKNEIEFSVIIPVYNAREYLQECLESVIKQTYVDFELIIIDDGSTDGSGELCDDFAEIDDRIKVIHQKNQGSLNARKKGVNNARGKNVIFVDADDWINKNELEIIAKYFKNNDVDMIEFGLWKNYNNGFEVERVSDLKSGKYNRNDLWNAFDGCIDDKTCFVQPIFLSLCTKAIKTSIIRNALHKIDERIVIGEDACVTFALLHEISSMLVIQECLYHYRENNKSRLHDDNKDKENYNLFRKQLSMLQEEYQEPQDRKYMNYISLLEACLQEDDYVISKYIIPFIYNKKVVLFGKGVFSKFLQRICKSNDIKIKGVIDSEDIQRIGELDFDIVFIAITISSFVDKARNTLIEHGVHKNKIKYITIDMFNQL